MTCWQLLVLHTARQAGFTVESSVSGGALGYLDRAYSLMDAEAGQNQSRPAGSYWYPDRRLGSKPSRSSTALTLFIQSLYDVADEDRTRAARVYMNRYAPTWGGPQYGGFFYFSSFYMVQGMFQAGGEEWAAFGPRLATVLLDHQAGDGSWPYPPDNSPPAHMQGTGPAYPVAMAVLMLSIDKQYLPMYQRQKRLYEPGLMAASASAPAAATSLATPPRGRSSATASAMTPPSGPGSTARPSGHWASRSTPTVRPVPGSSRPTRSSAPRSSLPGSARRVAGRAQARGHGIECPCAETGRLTAA